MLPYSQELTILQHICMTAVLCLKAIPMKASIEAAFILTRYFYPDKRLENLKYHKINV